MIIKPDKNFESNSMFPNENFYPNYPENLVINETTDEGKRLAELVKANSPYFDIVQDSFGNVVDIIVTVKPADPLAYQQLREAEYPPIGDQLDALWKMLVPPVGSDAEIIKAKWQAVKDKYPKPEGV